MDIKELSDVESEAAIVATLICHPDYLLYSEHLKPDHFYDLTDGVLYWGIQQLYKDGIENIDAFNLSRIINSKEMYQKQLDKDNSNINDLIDLTKTIARHSVEEYNKLVGIVNTCAFKRELYKTLQTCERLCFNDKLTLKDIQRNLSILLDKTNIEFITSEETKLFSEVVRGLWEETQSRQVSGGIVGIPSAFKSLNKYCTYENGELVVVTAHRKDGKSMFCMNELIDKIRMGINVLYFDTEMSDRLFNNRLICNLANIEMNKLKSGDYSEEKAKKIAEVVNWIETTKTFSHVYCPTYTKEELYIISKKMQKNNGVDFVIFDYFKSTEQIDSSKVYNELGNIVNFLKNDICGELQLSGLGAAQLNRGGEIADSLKIEQYSSTILVLKRKTLEEQENDGATCGNYKLFVKLNRLGDQMDDIANDYIDLQFTGNMCQFEEAKQHKNDFMFK